MQKRGLGKGLSALIPQHSTAQSAEPTDRGPRDGDSVVVPIEQVETNPYQPRTVFDAEKMADLAASIREHGILQPVLVRRMAPGRYQLVAGERRFRAAQRAGLSSIPAIVKECGDREQLEMAVVENLQREDIGVIEAARAYRKLIDEFEMTQDTVAKRVGKSRSAVANMLRLLRLPHEVLESVEQGEITEGHARALMMAEFSQAIIHAWNETRRKRLSVRETERLAKRSREAVASGPAGAMPVAQPASGVDRGDRRAAEREDANNADVADRIQQALGTKVSIRTAPGGIGRIEIECYSADELERVADMLLTLGTGR
ncbi:MAG TPA: ParB/RepB/Spo0J family partition protein [Chthonomonadaceae bacterium]|nr:ParB/RepB/Spo0J family partition protein [Chthonomonadaceae bacterium]